MDKSVGSTIEKIKLLEQDKDAKLKEKRELDGVISSLKKSIRETLTQSEKASQEIKELIQTTDKMRAQLEIEKLNRDAIVQQLEASNAQLQELTAKSDQGISEVWKLRSSFSQTVQSISDECDVRALLSKPIQMEPVVHVKHGPDEAEMKCVNESRLKEALARRERARAERDRLMMEPDNGEEFVRKLFQKLLIRRTYTNKIEEINENAPIKFTTSAAAKKYTFNVIKKKNPNEEDPWYQMYSVIGSVTAFLIYFCVLREENDIDLQFNVTLYDRIKGLEKSQLLQSYKYNKENGLSVTEIEQRLKEIEEKERAALAAETEKS